MAADAIALRNRLHAELTETAAAIQEASRSAGIVELDQASVGRVSRIDALQQQALAKGLMERLVVRKRRLEAALERVETGIYGLCCACQAELEAERLAADAAVVFCTDCAAEHEKI